MDCLDVKFRSPTQFLGVSDSRTTVSVERCFYYGTPKCKVMQSFPFLITFKPGTDHVEKVKDILQ